jgi:hypothetical protein
MTNILKQVAKSHHSRFRPSSPDEYFALRLASLLGEPEAAAHYATLASQYPRDKLLVAYRRAVSRSQSDQSPPKAFHDCLSVAGTGGTDSVSRPRLLAVRIERRAVAVAVFSGLHLEGRRVLQLSSDPDRAQASAIGFIREVLLENPCPSAAMETVADDISRAAIYQAMLEEFRSEGVSLWEIPAKTVLKSLCYPPLKSRSELHELMQEIWPVQGLKQSELCALDAFALGLYVQTERLFALDS